MLRRLNAIRRYHAKYNWDTRKVGRDFQIPLVSETQKSYFAPSDGIGRNCIHGITWNKTDSDNNVNLVQLAAGYGFFVGISVDGKLYGKGINSAGQLCNQQKFMSDFQPIKFLNHENERFTMVSCGRQHFGGLGVNGEVFFFGSNAAGQLGCRPNRRQANNFSFHPELVLGSEAVKLICSMDHSLILLENGRVASFGLGCDGQLGHRSLENCYKPTIIKNLNNIIDIQSNGDWNIALSKEGEVYAWGNNEYHQINSSEEQQIHTPEEIKLELATKIVGAPSNIAASMNMGLVRTSKGYLYSWGYGRGVNGNIEQSLNPISVMLTSDVVPDELTAGVNTLGVISIDTALLWGRESGDNPLIINNTDQINIGFDDVSLSRFMVESIEPEVFEPEICEPKAEVDDVKAPDRDIELIQMASELEALRAEKQNLEEKIYKIHEANDKTNENSEVRLSDSEILSIEQVTVTELEKLNSPNSNEKADIPNDTQIRNEYVQNKSEDALINLASYATFKKREFNQFNKRLVNENKSGYLGKNYDPNYKQKFTNTPSRKVGDIQGRYTKQDSSRVGYPSKNYDPNYNSRRQQPISKKSETKGIGYRGKNYDPNYAARWKIYESKKVESDVNRYGYQGKNYDPNYAARWKINESKKLESDVNRYGYQGKNFDPNYAARRQQPVWTKPVKRVGYVGKNYDPSYASRSKKIEPDNSDLKKND